MDPKDLANALYGKPTDGPKPPDPATGNPADRGNLMHEFKNALYPKDAEIQDGVKYVERDNVRRLADRYNWTEEEVDRRRAQAIAAFTKLGVPGHRAAALHSLIVERTLKEFSPEESAGFGEEANRRLRQKYGDAEAARVKTKFLDYEKSNPELSEMLTNDGLRNSPEIVELVASQIRRDEGRES